MAALPELPVITEISTINYVITRYVSVTRDALPQETQTPGLVKLGIGAGILGIFGYSRVSGNIFMNM